MTAPPHPANQAVTVDAFAAEHERRQTVTGWLRKHPDWRRVDPLRWQRISDGRTFYLNDVVRHNGDLRAYWALWHEAGKLPETGDR